MEDSVAGIPSVETFRAGCIEEFNVGGYEAHVRRGKQITRDNGTPELNSVHGAKRVAINQRACGFESRGVDWLLDHPSHFAGERVKSQRGFRRGHTVALAKSADGGPGFNLRQCGDDLVAVVFRLGKSQHVVAALLCDEEFQQGTGVDEVENSRTSLGRAGGFPRRLVLLRVV
jgi:hypothetical protein